MGGRIASLVADSEEVTGLVCLGFPFHAPGKKADARRLDPVRGLRTPALILQGTRDPMGSRPEVGRYRLARRTRVVWLEDGDHGFKPRKSSGETLEGHLERAVKEAAGFILRPGRK